jgi:hypothetical protein
MTTPKLLGKPAVPSAVYIKRCSTIITQCGRKFTWAHLVPHHQQGIKVGDKVWVARRMPVQSSEWCLEIYQVTIEEDPGMASRGHPNYPKTWFGGDRSIIWEI